MENIDLRNKLYMYDHIEELWDEWKRQIHMVLEMSITFKEWVHKYAHKFRNLYRKWYWEEQIKKLLFNK